MITKFKFFLLVFSTISQLALSQSSNDMRLKVLISDFPNDRGQCVVNLFVRGESLKEKPAHQQIAEIQDGNTVVEFELPYGEYAVIAWHDINSNADLDHNIFGIPSESLGFSNNWKASLFSGMPTFDKLKFNFSGATSVQRIKIK